VCCQLCDPVSVEPREKPHDAWSEFALSVFEVNGLIMRAGEGISGQVGQSSARWQVLGRAFEPQTVADMARDIGYARQSVQRVADILEKEGLVAYEAHPNDQRTKLVGLTPAGLDVLTAIYGLQVEWSRGVMARIGSEQLVEATRALQAIARSLHNELDADPPGRRTSN
jgi:DNA-binding MarR family transcriptional regulator